MEVKPKISRDEMYQVLSVYFPDDAENLTNLLWRDEGRFWGDYHMDVFSELCNLPENDSLTAKLRIPYVLFANHYFLLDAIVDGHLKESTNILFVSHLLIMVFGELFSEASNRLGENGVQNLNRLICKRIAENSDAIRRETIQRSTIYGLSKTDYEIIVGRSNSTLLFYEILCLLTNTEENLEIKQILSDLLYYMQLGDDVGDWRKDFENNNYTPLLQECIVSIPTEHQKDLKYVEKKLYIDGIFEKYMTRLVNDLNDLEQRLLSIQGINYFLLRQYIQSRREIAFTLMSDIVSTKLDFLSSLNKL